MLVVRVLAFWNLKDITGLGQYYQPEQTAALADKARGLGVREVVIGVRGQHVAL